MVLVPNPRPPSARNAAAASRPRPAIARGAARASSTTPTTASRAGRASPPKPAHLTAGRQRSETAYPEGGTPSPVAPASGSTGHFFCGALGVHVFQRAAPPHALPDQAADRGRPLGRPRGPEAHDRAMRRHEGRGRGGNVG